MDTKVKVVESLRGVLGSWPLALLPLRALKLPIYKQLLETHTFIKRWKQSSIPTGVTVVKEYNKLSPDGSRVVSIYFHFPCTNRRNCWMEIEQWSSLLKYLNITNLNHQFESFEHVIYWRTIGILLPKLF